MININIECYINYKIESYNLYTGSARSSTSREGYLEQVGAAMWTRPTWTVMLPISTVTSTRMATWTATIIPIIRTAMWIRTALSIATSSGLPRDFPESIIYNDACKKDYKYKTGNKDVPCVITKYIVVS